MTTAIFQSFDSDARGWGGTLAFGAPESVETAHTLAEVPGVLAAAETAGRDGKWAAVFVAYEAAAAFDAAFQTHLPVPGLPLAWCAVFATAAAGLVPVEQGLEKADTGHRTPDAGFSDWKPGISRDDYTAAIHRIRDYIAGGDTYQVNYTFPLHATLQGDPLAAFQTLGEAQGAGYSAYLNLGAHQLLCFSPELFFEREPQENRCGGMTVEQQCDGETQKHKAHAVSGTVTPSHRHTATPAFWRLVMRPMKGTMARGRFPAEDLARMRELAASEKNRAENLMILDMLRNDVGRLAQPGSVRVPRMFEVERYRTVHQMTSTVEATLRTETGLPEIFAALFPCASITGAPKIRTMQIIHELEPHPRGPYTGAIGLVRPGGAATFAVAIRTVTLESTKSGGGVLPPPETPGEWHSHGVPFNRRVAESAGVSRSADTDAPVPPAHSATPGVKMNPCQWHPPGGSGEGRTPSPDFIATFGVGGGITWDSTPEGEYDECMLKVAFLTVTPPHRYTATPAGSDFDLLESLLLEEGNWFLLELHLERMRASADYFARPFPEPELRAELERVRSTHPTGTWKIRLLLAAAGTLRAEAQEIQCGSVTVQQCDSDAGDGKRRKAESRIYAHTATPSHRHTVTPIAWRVALAAAPVDSRDVFLFHKTTRRAVYEAAKAAHPEAHDVILWNERGELTESCFANLVLELDGELVTPPVACGLLAGTFRQELLENGIVRERVLHLDDLAKANTVWLINSVRRWIPVELTPAEK